MARARRTTQSDNASLRDFLRRQDPTWLVDELVRAAEGDATLTARLRAAKGGGRPDEEEFSDLKGLLDRAIDHEWFVDWRAAPDYANDIHRALDRVEALIAAGSPDVAIMGAEYALTQIEDAFDHVDDSNGDMGSAAHRAQEIHLAACEAAQPDPVALGTRLAELALASRWEFFLDSPTTYASPLGEKGLRAFERIVDRRWSKLPQLTPGDERESSGWFTLTHLKELLAARRGVDAVVGVMSRDLSRPHRFLRIAEALAENDRIDDALEWLERGESAFRERDNGRLTNFAGVRHARAGRHREATDIAWRRFDRQPTLETYQQLQEFSSAAGTWPARRKGRAEAVGRPAKGNHTERITLGATAWALDPG